jgi:hypothetical protein
MFTFDHCELHERSSVVPTFPKTGEGWGTLHGGDARASKIIVWVQTKPFFNSSRG